MKYLIILTTLLIGMPTLMAQECIPDYYATYEFIVVTDTVKQSLRRPQEFALLKYDNRSYFKSINQRFNDSMGVAYANQHPELENYRTQQEMQEAVDAFVADMGKWRKSSIIDYRVVKNFKESTSYNILTFAFPPQHMETPLLTSWQLKPEKDTVAGLHCSKATINYGGRQYTAWYAPEIPISDGPYVFSGLPGLIVKIEDSRGWYKFQLSSFSTKATTRFIKANFVNPHSQPISRESYVHQSNNQKANPRIFGIEELDNEQLLEMKHSYKWRYYLVLEQED